MKALKKAIYGLTVAEMTVSAIAFAIMVLCYFISVVNRNFIKGSMPWTEEAALYSMVYLALLGMEVGLRDGTQVSVTAVTSKFEGKIAGKVLSIIAQLILLAFVAIMFNQSISLTFTQMRTGQTTPVLKIPMYLMYMSLIISFGITIITQVLILIGKIFNIPMDEITNVDAIIDGLMHKKAGKEETK